MSPVLTRAAARRWRAALVLLAVFPVATPSGAQIECLPLNAPYSELVRTYGDDYLFANAFLEVLSAGSVSLPWIDPITAELIAIDLREGNYLSAATRAYDWGEGKAMTLLAGPVVGAMVTAMRVGEALGMNRWEWRHAEVFDRAYSDLARLSPEYWPEDLRSFRRQTTEETRVIFEHHLPFMGNYVQATLPGPRWWRPTLTESERNERAYQALRAHALLEAALDAEGLQGADRTPERLQEILSERLRTQTEAEITRALVARQASACSDQPVAAPEPDPPAPGPTWQDHPDPLAAATAPEPEPDPPLATLPTTPDPIPAPAVEPDALAGPLVVSLLATERTSADTTTFRVEITNISGATVAGFRPSVQPERVPASGGHGTGFAFGEGVQDLAPGESVTLIFFGTGDIGAVHLDLSAGGILLTTHRFPVSATAQEDVAAQPQPQPLDAATASDAGDVPILAQYRGTRDVQWHQDRSPVDGEPDSGNYSCEIILTYRVDGSWQWSRPPCLHVLPYTIGIGALHGGEAWGAASEYEGRRIDLVNGALPEGAVLDAFLQETKRGNFKSIEDTVLRAGPDIFERVIVERREDSFLESGRTTRIRTILSRVR